MEFFVAKEKQSLRHMQIGMPDIVKGNDFSNAVHIVPRKFSNRAGTNRCVC